MDLSNKKDLIVKVEKFGDVGYQITVFDSAWTPIISEIETNNNKDEFLHKVLDELNISDENIGSYVGIV